MNISYNWLKQYINLKLVPSDLAKVLTDIGLEVESMESSGKYDHLKGLLIGEVRTCEKHPDADKLFITSVDIGQEKLLNIVCGAPNVATGQHVVVAPAGTTLYKGDESMQIKKVKIRGAVSEGMICAEDEIGMGNSHEGILILPGDAPVGIPAETYFNPEPDTLFTIGLTPNRIDSASHFGVARDLASFLRNDKDVRVTRPDVTSFREGDGSYHVKVIIENDQACRRYAGVCITGVNIAPSPLWLQKRLKSIGLNPINNVVDITNFVLYELGQPLHAFDADTLKGRMIVVKNFPSGTKFITLDGIERILSDQDLMICDAEEPVAIAGVFGGLHSGVTEATTNVFIESAYFDPVCVRRTSKLHGINTDASFRFERGVDPGITVYALKRCALLIEEIAGGSIASAIVDEYPNPIRPREVSFSYDSAYRLIGEQIEPDTIKSVLASLEFEITKEDDHGLTLLVPPYRVDVEREADVVEEILRIYGYNKISIPETLKASLSYSKKPDQETLIDTLSNYLCSNGFFEIMCNSLTKSAYYEHLTTFKSENLARLINPLSNDLNVMRQTLIFGGLETILYNTNRQRPDLKLFEFGKCYSMKKQKPEQNKDPLGKYHEEFYFSLFLTGKVSASGWFSRESPVNFFLLKAYLENIMVLLGIDPETASIVSVQDKKDLYEQGIRYQAENLDIAELALINPEILKTFDIRSEVCYAEIIWRNVLEINKKHQVSHKELPKYPEVRRDLSLLLDRSVNYERIKELAFKTESRLLKKIHLFDVYEGDKIEKGKKSYAVTFILQDPEKTLTDEKIDRVMKKLMDTYVNQLGAVIR
ncbi:MAG: phenylalanine--tRNA ligase subunit beta [Bacteroidales bacterium]|nr:phenylalanine--tRNA ligase subunit beta [Bacteroidales bacterium]